MQLFNAAVSRPEPIPVYAEMSAVNPVVILEGALTSNKEKIAKDLAASVTLGVGQFCTNPGLILLTESENANDFLKLFAEQVSNTTPATMLNRNICKAYSEGVTHRGKADDVKVLATASKPASEERFEAGAVVYTVEADSFLDQKELTDEIFGPSSLVVLCKNNDELFQVLQSMEGQLTATLHATDVDKDEAQPVIDIIMQKAGRLIYGGYPTGVEVCHSMQHGGPFPSTTDGRSTSVGTAAIYRFVRPLTFQDFPDQLLPAPLQNENPLNVLRLVDGEWTTKKL